MATSLIVTNSFKLEQVTSIPFKSPYATIQGKSTPAKLSSGSHTGAFSETR